MYITEVVAREVLDTRGKPTISCTITLNSGQTVQAHVSLDHDRYMCMDLHAALSIINQHIAPLLLGQQPCVVSMDMAMMQHEVFHEIAETSNSAFLATSIAVAKAQAIMDEMQGYELFAHICDDETVALPYVMVNMINGGNQTHGHISVQEFLIMPIGAYNFRGGMEMVQATFAACEQLLHEKKVFFGLGDDGGYTLAQATTQEILDLMVAAIERARLQDSVAIVLDVAADNLYDMQTQRYHIDGTVKTEDEMIAWYQQLCQNYPLYALEDPLMFSAYQGWQALTAALHTKIQIISDTFCALDPHHVTYMAEHNLATACTITPADMATVTQILQLIKACRSLDVPAVLASHFVDTTDSLMADLVVGTSLGHIKAGGIMRAEAIADYNRLFAIEDELMDQLLHEQ